MSNNTKKLKKIEKKLKNYQNTLYVRNQSFFMNISQNKKRFHQNYDFNSTIKIEIIVIDLEEKIQSFKPID